MRIKQQLCQTQCFRNKMVKRTRKKIPTRPFADRPRIVSDVVLLFFIVYFSFIYNSYSTGRGSRGCSESIMGQGAPTAVLRPGAGYRWTGRVTGGCEKQQQTTRGDFSGPHQSCKAAIASVALPPLCRARTPNRHVTDAALFRSETFDVRRGTAPINRSSGTPLQTPLHPFGPTTRPISNSEGFLRSRGLRISVEGSLTGCRPTRCFPKLLKVNRVYEMCARVLKLIYRTCFRVHFKCIQPFFIQTVARTEMCTRFQ